MVTFPSEREAKRELFNALAPERERWLGRSRYYHRELTRYLRFLIPEGSRVLEVGCGLGDLLADLKPSRGVGVDISDKMAELARTRHPELSFSTGTPRTWGLTRFSTTW